MRPRRLVGVLVVVLSLAAYPAFVLGYTWSHVLRSELPGGRHGPLDAYRHTLASAVVGFTLGRQPVEWTTSVMERDGRDANRMDRHNNTIGAAIGSGANSFSEIEPAVRGRVLQGTVDAVDTAQVTWLPRTKWRAGRLW